MRSIALLAALILSVAWPAHADQATPLAEDPAVEARVQTLGEELRCLVCQNQNIADSHADLAIDLKNQLREQVRAGRSDREIMDYMVERYGDFVLYRPPLKATTILLWLGPFAFLLVAIVVLFRRLRRRTAQAAAANTLSPDDQARARELLAGKETEL